jgi:hypothetical protein
LETLQYGATIGSDLDASDPFFTLSTLSQASIFVSGGRRGGARRATTWEVNAGVNRRTDLDLDTDIETVALGAAFGYPLSNLAALRFELGWAEELTPSGVEGNRYAEARLGIAWTPLGSRQLGPLGRSRVDATAPRSNGGD